MLFIHRNLGSRLWWRLCAGATGELTGHHLPICYLIIRIVQDSFGQTILHSTATQRVLHACHEVSPACHASLRAWCGIRGSVQQYGQRCWQCDHVKNQSWDFDFFEKLGLNMPEQAYIYGVYMSWDQCHEERERAEAWSKV